MSVMERDKPESAKIYDDDGRTVVPKKIREKLGAGEGDTLLFYEEGDEIKLYKAKE